MGGKLIIAIAGYTGCGKTSVAREVAKTFGYRTIETTFKELAAKRGIELMKFHKTARNDPKHAIDKALDEEIRRQAAGGNCVIATWLGPWTIPESFKVWLDVSEEIRAKRVAGREGWNLEKALAHIKERDRENMKRYREVYGIDITNHRIFDLIVNAGNLELKETAGIICKAVQENEKLRR